MSLVQAYINENFILVCGEQKAQLTDGTIIENFIKVHKINNSTIIGLTGTIEGNYILFSDYINEDFTLKKPLSEYNYFDIEQKTILKYNINYEYFEDHPVISLICGWDGRKMTGKTFFSNLGRNAINDLTPEYPGHIRLVNCGLDIHNENAEKMSKLNPPKNILQLKNLFRDVVDEGIKFDNTINKNITFQKIKRSDFG